VIIARPVPNIIAPDNPWNILRTISEVILREKIIRKVEMVNSNILVEKIFFRPIMSASLPKGKRNIAAAKIKLLITHPRLIALALRSLPIDGRARLTAEPRKESGMLQKLQQEGQNFLKSYLRYYYNSFFQFNNLISDFGFRTLD